MERQKKCNKREILALICTSLTAGICIFLSRCVFWMMRTWNGLTIEEVIYHLTSPIEGTDRDIIRRFVLNCVLPGAAVIAVAAVVLVILWKKRRRFGRAAAAICGGTACILAVSLVYLWTSLDVSAYIKNQITDSTFIQDHYVDPADVDLTFPEKKRNLIYIYLESMETTYTDTENGGGFAGENFIPRLTKIAQENEDFSGTDRALDGGSAMHNTTWTVAAMFAQSSGLPLTLPLSNHNAMNTQEEFFPDVTDLGDILEDNGYHNVFLLGSDIEFGGRKLLFTQHGDYTIYDYVYSNETGEIAPDYHVFWGYEDEKLFEHARNHLTELAAGPEPFNLTILTVDTHFEDGYVCRDCGDSHGDNQYGNVINCSDNKVADFVAWVQQQPFYENTTIILSGDHPTMDVDFCNDITEAYNRRTYTAVINSPVSPAEEKYREYATFDMFPTTLAALGVTIPGNRLGLGANLFSTEQTILEQYGYDYANGELEKHSSFMDELTKNIDIGQEMDQTRGELSGKVLVHAPNAQTGNVSIQLSINSRHYIAKVTCAVSTLEDGSDKKEYDAGWNADHTFIANINPRDFASGSTAFDIEIYAADDKGELLPVAQIEDLSLEDLPYSCAVE